MKHRCELRAFTHALLLHILLRIRLCWCKWHWPMCFAVTAVFERPEHLSTMAAACNIYLTLLTLITENPYNFKTHQVGPFYANQCLVWKNLKNRSWVGFFLQPWLQPKCENMTLRGWENIWSFFANLPKKANPNLIQFWFLIPLAVEYFILTKFWNI